MSLNLFNEMISDLRLDIFAVRWPIVSAFVGRLESELLIRSLPDRDQTVHTLSFSVILFFFYFNFSGLFFEKQ